MVLYSFLAVLVLCGAHIFVHKLRLTNIPRSKWLSVAGGISVAYIFLQAFPELREVQEDVNSTNSRFLEALAELEVYLLSLAGLCLFYGLENRAKKSVESNREPAGEEKNFRIFWIHILSFALYNFIIGYLLLNREEESLQNMALYTVAMGFHFIVTDHALEDHFSRVYRKFGRWILTGSIFIGWAISVLTEIPELYIGLIFSFLAGGVIMNVLKEELPKERESNLFAFLMGIFFYGVILIFV